MHDKTNIIKNTIELQNIVGEAHDIIKAKVQPQLDRHCLTYLEQSQIVFLGFWYENISDILILKGPPGFIQAVNHTTLRVPYQQEFSLIESKVFDELLPVSLYCWVPGIEDTLRINGVAKWSVNTNDALRDLHIEIDGAYLHCAKSIKRPKLWQEKKSPEITIGIDNNFSKLLSNDCKLFINSSPFLCLHTQTQSNKTELSPRGDPPGFVHIIDNQHLLIPDRPGNKRVDSMRNLLTNPQLGIIFLIPGTNLVLKINGRATIIRDPELLQLVAIKNKPPKLGILVTVAQCQFHKTNSLNWDEVWKQSKMVDKEKFPSLGQVLAEQNSKNQSFVTKLKGKVIEAVIQRDYKNNLY